MDVTIEPLDCGMSEQLTAPAGARRVPGHDPAAMASLPPIIG